MSPGKKASPKPKFTLPPANPRVAAIQMSSGPDIDRNLGQARELLDEALRSDPNIVAFPENMLLFSDSTGDYLKHAQAPRGNLVGILQEWAAEADVWLLAGSLPFRATAGKVFNTSILFSPEGDLFARYDKIHLFDVNVPGDRSYKESDDVAPGKKAVTAVTPWGNLGLSICYDVRFPELYRRHADAAAHTLFVPAAFTAVTGKAHWDVLTRARAIENQCFLVAPGQTGKPFPGRECHGHTRIVDPWGRIIAERPAGIGVVIADLDYGSLFEIRAKLPALAHRRLK
ncbi:MAG: carbon-nitrogen hydrolase family protein [Bdellovibrionales bacterium]|nr:carbon-nitrogen hydrolase family protein [Bdellovibrionales bacterium]